MKSSRCLFIMKTIVDALFLGILLFPICNLQMVDGMSASPKPFRERQPTGDETPYLFIRGDPKFHYMVDSNGFTVVQNANKTFVFANLDDSGTRLVPTDLILGQRYPSDMVPNSIPNYTMRASVCGRLCEVEDAPVTSSMPLRSTVKGGVAARKNLVILIRFADHSSRILPPLSDFDTLFNNISPGSPIAPAGGVRQYFRLNSYGSVDLHSVLYGWVDLPETEAFYADGQSGLSDAFPKALFHALDAIDASDFPWEDLDENGDGIIDSLTLIHSGYAAEWGQTDSNGQPMSNRIWSHHWTLPRSRRWKSSSGYLVDKYITCPGLWNTRGSNIGRMGVIVHELGHSLGLPDLYGSGNMIDDNGIGSYDVMSNAWGFDSSQNYPPHLCPWSKIVLGWSRPLLISQGGNFDISLSASYNQFYRIDLGMTEYLLIENRQAHAFDAKLPAGGLAIWHIDEAATDLVPGFPGQAGWPKNGNHYRVALLQADGKYDLEQGTNTGDSGDLFSAGGQGTLGPTYKGGTHPNTDAYQGGLIKPSGVTIENISASSNQMKFAVSLMNKPLPTPTPSPTFLPVKKELVAGFQAGTGGAGNMFDVSAKKNLVLTEVVVNTYATSFVQIEIWSRIGTYQGHENERSHWELIKSEKVIGKGVGKGTPINIPELEIRAEQTRSFYITTDRKGSLAFTKGQSVGTVYASNDDIQIREGVSKSYPFGATYPMRRWNGVLKYEIVNTLTSWPSVASFNPPESPISNRWFKDDSVTTIWDGGSAGDGNMFDVMPVKNMMITGFDLHVAFKKEVTIEVYTKRDSFRGHETVCSDWKQVARVKVIGEGHQAITSLPRNSFAPIMCERFQIYSFYISVVSSEPGGVIYTNGDGSGSPIAQDDNIMVFQGVGSRYPCLAAYPGRIWNGVIYYTVTEEPLEIVTSFLGINKAAGNMFNVVANKVLEVVGLELHIALESKLSLEVFIKAGSYEGFENHQDSWRLVTNTTVVGKGIGERTIVPVHAFEPIHIDANTTVAIYVTVNSRNMRYSREWEYSHAASNVDMTVTKGVGKDYSFGASYPDRVWNGVLRYNLL